MSPPRAEHPEPERRHEPEERNGRVLPIGRRRSGDSRMGGDCRLDRSVSRPTVQRPTIRRWSVGAGWGVEGREDAVEIPPIERSGDVSVAG
jgi:hypothetical protein